MTTPLVEHNATHLLHAQTVREVLPNGLTLLMRRDASAPVVAIVTHVKAGYFDEHDGIVGIAHVLEHMFFKGTPTRGVGAIARDTKANGGYLNAHTIYDHTTYYTVLPSASLLQGLDIQCDAYARSLIDADELARELEVIIQEVKRKRDTPSAVAIESLYALLHDHHRIRRWRIGEESALRTFTQQALLSFYRAWYQPSNTILSIVGDIDYDRTRRAVVERYGALENVNVPRETGPVEVALPGVRLRDFAGDIAQQQLAVGWRAPGLHHPDTPALDLVGVALGTGRASRLYRAVRDRQLASSASAWHYTTGDLGVFVLHAEAPASTARDALQQTWREWHAARTDGFRATEVVRAQRILESRWLRRLESMDGQATYLASWEADGGLVAAERYYERIRTLDADALQGAMQRHLDPAHAAFLSYRPSSSEPIADSTDMLRALLHQHESAGSSVMRVSASTTPLSVPAVSPAPSTSTVRPYRDEAGVVVYTLASGITVLVLPRPGAPLASVGVFQRGGSACEPAGLEGLARLTAHAMLKGTTTRTGASIAEATEELGGSISVGPGLEGLSWSLSVPTPHLDTAITLLADVVQDPVFPDEGVESERAVALAEVTRLRDDMYRWPMRLATEAAYGAHPYARTVLGTRASLQSITIAQVRQFHADAVRHGATVIAVVGDVDVARTLSHIESNFRHLTLRVDAAPAVATWPAHAPSASDVRDKQQTALALLFPSPARHDPDRYAARVLSAIASGLGGRFFEQLRDRQSLAYTVSAFPVERRGGGVFVSYIATSPSREAEARDGLMAQFALLREAPPSAEELRRAQQYLVGTHAIAQQSGGSVLSELVDSWLFGVGLRERHDEVGHIQAVTARDVHHLCERYFDPSSVVEGIVRGQSGG
ncbi:MAG: insulinase family protein [Gemmatimonadaceae bacterium]|nr:insulinase family protein [Gemmatimonadaceae bacterium]